MVIPQSIPTPIPTEAYTKLSYISLPDHLTLLCHPWSGAEEMTSNSILQHHQDWKDIQSAPQML